MHKLAPLALLFATTAASALQPADVQITTDPSVTVKVTRNKTNTSKQISVTVNAQDKVTQIKIGAAPVPAPLPAPAPSPEVPMPPVVDHSAMGPLIDKALIPTPEAGETTARVRSVWRDASTGKDCTPGALNCSVPSSLQTAPSDLGAFRTTIRLAKMAFDDPIVFPGQPGKSHLHTFFGNTGVDANSTTDSIANAGGSTNAGGILNRSVYWVPAMIDTGNGRPIVPADSLVYYKGSYEFDITGVVVPPPSGLRMVSGNAKETDPKKTGARYLCYGPAGENPGWSGTLTEAVAKGTCMAGGRAVMEVPFPMCWDGVNLDSPNHASHMSFAVQDQQPPFAKHCPTTHPVVLPVITYELFYPITDDAAVSRWRLSSDMDPALPAGISGHGDYWFGWDKATAQAWVTGCIKAKRDCHADLLGDGRTLY